jgi:TIR domain
MVRIFISYNRASLEVVQTVADDLQTAGHEVWFDRSINGGQQWWNEILRRIRECDVLIFALSPEATESRACGEELRYAQQLGKGILPLLVADGIRTDLLPRALGEIQHIDYRSPDRRTCFALSRALNGFGSAPPLPDPLPEPPAVPVSYLHDVQEKIDSAAPLGFEEQAALVLELKGKLGQSASRDDVFELLRRMRRRDDLLALIAGEIDFLLAQVRGEETKPEPAEAAAARPVVNQESDEIAQAVLRVVQLGEIWRLGEDPQNRITVELLISDGEAVISATLTCRDNVRGAKASVLKQRGWKTDDNTVVAGVAGGALLYATSGLGAVALLSKKVRDWVLALKAQRTWPATTEGFELTRVAKELHEAMSIISPDLKTLTLKQLRGAPAAQLTHSLS